MANITTQAQILDDTTTDKYGTRTTRYRLLQDVFINKDTLYRIDTVLRNFQNHDDYIFRESWPYQDLGNLGTAQQLMFRRVQGPIGIQFGFNAYDQFALDPDKAPYYNTFSPHTWADYVQGPLERSIFNMGFSRNIGARTNFSFEYQRIGSVKTFGAVRAEDPAASHHSYRTSLSHVNKTGRFQTYLTYTHMWHKVFETGGVLPTARDSSKEADPLNRKLIADSMLFLEIQRPQLLDGTYSLDSRHNVRWYTQYAFTADRKWQAFYKFDRDYRRQTFWAPTVAGSPYFRDTVVWRNTYSVDTNGQTVLNSKFRYDQTNTFDEVNYINTAHQAGIKGQLGPLFVSGWARYREFGYDGTRFGYEGVKSEFYLGGTALLKTDDRSYIDIKGQLIPGRDYLLEGTYKSKSWLVEAVLKRYAPTLLEQAYAGNHFSWQNDLNFTSAQRITANYLLPVKRLTAIVGAEYQNWDRLVVFDATARPKQITDATGLVSAFVNWTIDFWRIRSEQQVRFTANTGADVIRVPNLWVHQKIYYFYQPSRNKGIELHTGLDIRYRTAYKADNYMAVTQQFYIQSSPDGATPAAQQNIFLLAPTIVVDPYVTMRIYNARVFVKVNNVLQGVGGNGYFTTPFYPGLQRSFQFGIKWYFFD